MNGGQPALDDYLSSRISKKWSSAKLAMFPYSIDYKRTTPLEREPRMAKEVVM